MKTIITVECVDQDLMITNSPLIASGGLHENYVSFKFCPKWDKLSKTAVFCKNENEKYYAVIDANNTCEIPHEITDSEGAMLFGVVGVSNNITKTSKVLRYKIVEGAIVEGATPSDPTPDIYEQLLANYADIISTTREFQEETLALFNAHVGVTVNQDSGVLTNSFSGRLKAKIKGAMEQGENPSPTNQQEIKNSVVSGIKTHWKNFWNNTLTILSYTYLMPIKSGETLTFSYDYSGEENKNRYGLYIFDEIGSYGSSDTYIQTGGLVYATANGRNLLTITASADGYLYFRQVSPSNYTCLSNLQLEKGGATPYEPYTESSITFSQPIELYGLEDVRDILTTKQIKRKFVKRVLNGSEDWKTSSSLTGRYYVQLGGSKYAVMLCTQYVSVIGVSTTIGECYFSSTNVGRLCVNTEFATLDEWKAHLQANPMTVVYEMAEETTEDLPIVDQIALNNLQTFDGVTYIEFDSEVQPNFTVEYGSSRAGALALENSNLHEINTIIMEESATKRIDATLNSTFVNTDSSRVNVVRSGDVVEVNYYIVISTARTIPTPIITKLPTQAVGVGNTLYGFAIRESDSSEFVAIFDAGSITLKVNSNKALAVGDIIQGSFTYVASK